MPLTAAFLCHFVSVHSRVILQPRLQSAMLNLTLTPVSTGRIFCSSSKSFEKKKRLPTTPLPANHPFWQLWRDHLISLGEPGNSDALINALIAIALKNAEWDSNTTADVIAARQQEMRNILARHPPDVVLLTNITPYGCHFRDEVLWPYICINEDYVDAWIAAVRPVPNTKEYLSLTALLRACLNHEIGHWVQTLVTSSYRYYGIHAANFHIKTVGYFSSKACRPHPPHSELIKNTPKSLSAPWTSEGEAGDYVEVCSQGGIIRYSAIRKKGESHSQQDMKMPYPIYSLYYDWSGENARSYTPISPPVRVEQGLP